MWAASAVLASPSRLWTTESLFQNSKHVVICIANFDVLNKPTHLTTKIELFGILVLD